MGTLTARSMPTLRERLSAYFTGLIPTKRVTVYNDRYAPRLLAQTMDVDRVHSIIEGAVEDGDTRDLFPSARSC